MKHRTGLILAAVGTGTFMSALDSSVVNATLPVISEAFGNDIATIEWVVTTYLLVVSGLLLSFGRLGDLRGHKRVYVLGFGIFIIASLLCGLAPSAGALVAARAVQAVGGATLFANSAAILTTNFPPERRGRTLGLQAMMTYLGLTTGPSLGGLLTSWLGWRSIFYINLPIGLLALALSLRFIPDDRPARQAEHFDLPGAAVFIAGLTMLLLVLNQGHVWGWLSPQAIGLFMIALALLSVFVVMERRVAAPMLDLSLFGRRLFSVATASAVLNYVCLYSITFLLPFYLIQGRGLGSAQTGLILTAQPLVMAVAAPISGALSDRVGSRVLSPLGMLILAFGLALLARLDAASSIGQVIVGLAVAGLGTGIFISPNTSALMGAAPRGRQGIASGILATARNAGMALGVGLAGAIYSSVLAAAPATDTALFTAIGAAFLVASAVGFVGTGVSAIRGA
ncbi:MAG: Multidrug resistance protein stp [Chloroflexi bacterium ADurb.Bin325]|nr:MAG: Multidrug resistance protein stp [Chloroflexi bacterium ADurb.Bin325]